MPYLFASDGGVNRQLKSLYAPDGGVNRKLKSLWAPDQAINRKIFSGAFTWTYAVTQSNVTVTVNAKDVQFHPTGASASATATFTFDTPITFQAGDTITLTWPYDSSGHNITLRVYINGTLINTTSTGNSAGTYTYTFTAEATVTSVAIGCSYSNTSYYPTTVDTLQLTTNGKAFYMGSINTSDQ